MATGMNHELHTLQKYKSAIISRVATQVNPGSFSLKLQEKGMISAENASAIVNNLALSDQVKVDRLIQAVESKLRHGSNRAQVFQDFIEILSIESVLEDLVRDLQTEHHRRNEEEPENGDTAAEESRLLLMEEQTQTEQVEQELRSRRAREIRRLQQRCDNRCIALTFCCVCLSLIVVMIFTFLISGKIDLHLRLNRDTEQEITKSSVPYGSYRWIKLFIKQEFLLGLSCFIICTPWILAQYMCQEKERKLPVATCCCLLMVGVSYFLKDFECFQIDGLLLVSAGLSFGILSPVAGELPKIRHLYKHFCLRLFIVLLWLTVMMLFIFCFLLMLIGLIVAFKPDIQPEVQENKLQGHPTVPGVFIQQEVQENKLQGHPTVPGVFIQQEVQENKLQGLQSPPTVPGVFIQQEVQENKLQGLQSHPTVPGVFIQQEVQKNKLQGLQSPPTVPEMIIFYLIVCVAGILLIISANIELPIYQNRTIHRSALYLSILGVVTTFSLFSALLLKATITVSDIESLVAVPFLLLSNLILLTATASIKRLPFNLKLLKNIIVCFGIIIGIRNLLLEALMLWKAW